ncbi:N-6 DNA methylase [Streptomyces sp. NPDC026672]|uniref:N-6 DNA methylase n=1 Tax=unclassified Streptomyces TaxID=2593676 RepID=UPI0033F86A37
MAVNFTLPEQVEHALRGAMAAAPRALIDSRERRDVALALLLSRATLDDAPSAGFREAPAGPPDSGPGGPLSRLFEERALALLNEGRLGGEGDALLAQFLRRAAVTVSRTAETVQAELMDVFRGVDLGLDALAYPEMLGDVMETFLKESEAAARHSGEHYTPRELVHLLTEISRPREGMRIHDPFCGTGGMLLHAERYVDEQGGDARRLALVGQDVSRPTAELAALNLSLHRIQDVRLEVGDSLSPGPPGASECDLVLSVPPFGLFLHPDQAQALRGHAPYGPVSEKGPADWALIQYMLGLVDGRGGSVCTVVTHGALFRGGRDQATRSALLDADVVEAVVGLAPNLFSSATVPPCVLLLRAPGRKAPERRGKVLFVDASREYHQGAAQNHMRPEHVERIASAVRDFTDVDRFARVVDRERLSDHGDSLDIRRYVDSAPLPEPQDLRAHMSGGMPVAEIKGKGALLDAYGITPRQLFVPRYGDPEYMDFPPPGERPDDRGLADLAREREQRLRAAVGAWWERAERAITEFAPKRDGDRADNGRTGRLRLVLSSSWRELTEEPDILAPQALSGVFTDWWRESGPQLRTWTRRGRLLPPAGDLSVLGDGLTARIDALVGARRAELVETYRGWYEKYGLSFREIESQLTGPSVGFLQNNPWSQQSAWDFPTAGDTSVAEGRQRTVQRIYALTDTEKTVDGALAKLDVDELMVLLPVLDAASEADGVERCLLGDVVTAARTGTSGQLTVEPDGAPAVEAKHLTERGFVATGMRHRRPENPPRPSELLSAGDVLLTSRVMAGRGYRAVVWDGQPHGATYGGSVMRLSCDTTRLLPGYLAVWLSHRSVHPRLYAQARESRDGLYDLPAGRLRNVEIELPGLAEQRRVVEVMSALAEQRELRHAQLAKLELIKKTMINDLQSDRTSVAFAN